MNNTFFEALELLCALLPTKEGQGEANMEKVQIFKETP